MKRWNKLSGLMVVVTLLWGLVAVPLHSAMADDRAGDISTHKAGQMDSKEQCRGKHPGKLLAVIVPCIRDMVEDATETMTDQFDEYVKSATWAFAVLVVTMFGVKMLINEGDLKKEGIILLMKIGGVALFMDNFGGFIHDMFAAVQDGSEMVTTALHQAGGQCPMGDYQGEEPWNKFDCILGQMYGFGNGQTIGTTIFGLVAGAGIVSGQFGQMLTMGAITALTLILRLVIRAVYTYLMALVVMGFLIVISPVLIPLIFMGVTFQYFEHWLRALMSTMIMPLIVLAYVTLAFVVLDKMMFDDQKGIAKMLTKDDAEKAQRGVEARNSNTFANNPKFYSGKLGAPEKWYDNKAVVDSASPILSGATDSGTFGSRYTFNFGKDNVKKSQDIHIALIAFLITAYLLDVMLDNIVGTAQTMLGGGFALGAATKSNPLEDGLNKIKENALKDGGAGGGAGIKGFMDQFRGLMSR